MMEGNVMAEYGVPSTVPTYGSCGVSQWSGAEFRTKKALKDAIAEGQAIKVRILSLGGERTVFLRCDEDNNEGGVFYVCGPVAEWDRKWYAEIAVYDGKVKVS